MTLEEFKKTCLEVYPRATFDKDIGKTWCYVDANVVACYTPPRDGYADVYRGIIDGVHDWADIDTSNLVTFTNTLKENKH